MAAGAAVDEAAQEEGHAHDEEQVREDGTEHRRLDDFNLAVAEGDDADLQ